MSELLNKESVVLMKHDASKPTLESSLEWVKNNFGHIHTDMAKQFFFEHFDEITTLKAKNKEQAELIGELREVLLDTAVALKSSDYTDNYSTEYYYAMEIQTKAKQLINEEELGTNELLQENEEWV